MNKTNNTICIIRSNAVDPDSRVEKEAITLKRLGYNVVILAWDRSSDHKIIHEYISVYGESIDIYRLGNKANFGDGMKSLIPYIKFQIRQFFWLIKNRKNINAIHACDFDTAFFSLLANFFIRKKFVFDIFDFIYGKPKNLFQKLIKHLQIFIINKADATIICTEKRKSQIKPSKPKNLTVIHNTPINIEYKRDKIKIENQNEEPIKIVYVGILQDFRLLTEIANVLKGNSKYEMHIGGFGKYEKFFKELNDKYKNIKYYGKLSYEQTLTLEQSCDIMLAIYDPNIENHFYAAPNKFYESLMLGKPLIMVKETGMSEFIEQYKIGTLIDYSPESFIEGVEYLVSIKDNWKVISNRMYKLYNSNFRWEVMANRLKLMYKKVFNTH